MLTAITFLRGSHRGERTDNVPDSLSDLPGCVGLSVSRSVDMGLNVGSRTANFLRSASELITMCGPIMTVSDILHDGPQGVGKLRVLREHGTDHAEEYGDIAGKSRRGPSGRRVEVCKRRVWGIVGRRRWDFLDIDSSIG